MTNIFCTSCGSKHPQTARFCSSCGTPIGNQLGRALNKNKQEDEEEYTEEGGGHSFKLPSRASIEVDFGPKQKLTFEDVAINQARPSEGYSPQSPSSYRKLTKEELAAQMMRECGSSQGRESTTVDDE